MKKNIMNNGEYADNVYHKQFASKTLLFCLLTFSSIFLFSCGQKTAVDNLVETPIMVEQPLKSKYSAIHSYGGWSCPDNVFGFPAVDIQELDLVPVVNGRLPTKEETKNGISLMYFDPAKIPNAKPLDMVMPKLARYYSEYTKKNELVIVIQAVTVDQDTVVGFRYLNGGNGSAWFGEVSFLSEAEIDQLGPTPFVSLSTEIYASKEKIWEVITSPIYAKVLGEIFDKNAYLESDWERNSKVYFKYGPDSIAATGLVTASWKHTYIQTDYNFDGYHYVEKFLLSDNEKIANTPLQIVCGPYGEDYEAQIEVWKKWLEKVKQLSENQE